MPDPDSSLVERFVGMLQQDLRRGKTLDAAHEEAKVHFDSPAQSEALALAVVELQRRISGIEHLGFPNALRRQNRSKWYAGPQDGDVYWPPLRAYLRDVKRWPAEVVASIDDSSSKVLSCLDFPGNLRFSTRGLVVGYVQSGKTANFTALISKAADAGYRVFIVLSGLTNSLRRQTQERLDKELVSLNPTQWMTWTDANSDIGDFAFSADAILTTAARHLAVVKKNGPRLRRLLRKLRDAQRSVLEQCPVLLIDDECDQASVNASGSAERLTVINRLLRDLLKLLPRAAYVGYTATPYANVLIDPGFDEDLYPRDFIVSLPAPVDYFGAERLFGRDLLAADDVPPADGGLNMIRQIPEDETPLLRPKSRNDKAFALEITTTLREAIQYYLLATAAKHVRGLGHEHSCMLIHTTVYAQAHLNAQPVVQAFVRRLLSDLERDDTKTWRSLEELWKREQRALPSEIVGCSRVAFSDLREHLLTACRQVNVCVENSFSDTRLNFSEAGRRYIVIGGNVLARGLTIEGLIVSYFLRTASQYDTLMQMGRWFGYRKGYEDLPRIWMTDDMADYFHDMATIEAEIRHEIAVYDREKVSPTEFAVRVRQLPDLAITAPGKMFSAVDCQMSFSGDHIQTRKFNHNNRDWLIHNWKAGATLISSITDHCRSHDGTPSIVFEEVPFTKIIAFLKDYTFHEAHRQFAGDRLVEYIREQVDVAPQGMREWNVVIVGTTGGSLSEEALGPAGRVRTVTRARLNAGHDADIKALMSRGDILADLPEVPRPPQADWSTLKELRAQHFKPAGRPLLLLYPIDRHSAPSGAGTNRIPLDAAADVLGVGVVFPKTAHDTPLGYKRAPIDPAAYEEIEYEEEKLEADVPTA